jgi:hypothetical protein
LVLSACVLLSSAGFALSACAGRDSASKDRETGGASGAGSGGASDGGTLAGGGRGGTTQAGSGGEGRGGGGGAGSAGDTGGDGASSGASGAAGADAGGVAGASGASAAGADGAAGGMGNGTGGGGTGGSGAGGSAGGSGLDSVTLFLMFDRSWSMTQCADPAQTVPPGATDLSCPDGGPDRWDLTSQALVQFFQAPEAADLNVALRFFPDDAAGCTGFSDFDMVTANCDISACAEPLVDEGRLTADPAPTDQQEAALVAAIEASVPPELAPVPSPGTPTYPALAGAATWAMAYRAAHPAERTMVVLVTDGEPFGCDTNVNNIAAVAADARAEGVSTYVIGLDGSSVATLEAIATAGGTVALFVSDGASLADDLLASLRAVAEMP